ncbi:PAS domain S-box protein [Chloroflexota bacterium]
MKSRTSILIKTCLVAACACLLCSCSSGDSSSAEIIELEQKLMQSDDSFYALTHFLNENVDQGIVFVSMDGKIQEANQKYLDILGYTMEEAKSLTYQQITPEKWSEMEDLLRENQVMNRGYCRIYEKEYVRKDGTVCPIRTQAWLITDENGEPWRLMGIVREIDS